jgi:hypothetical protein
MSYKKYVSQFKNGSSNFHLSKPIIDSVIVDEAKVYNEPKELIPLPKSKKKKTKTKVEDLIDNSAHGFPDDLHYQEEE